MCQVLRNVFFVFKWFKKMFQIDDSKNVRWCNHKVKRKNVLNACCECTILVNFFYTYDIFYNMNLSNLKKKKNWGGVTHHDILLTLCCPKKLKLLHFKRFVDLKQGSYLVGRAT